MNCSNTQSRVQEVNLNSEGLELVAAEWSTKVLGTPTTVGPFVLFREVEKKMETTIFYIPTLREQIKD